MSWKEACRKLGAKTISQIGEQPMRDGGKLADQGVGGVQMADVSVDTETGIVKINKMVAVQDCGLIIDLKTAESQVYGALIMGICWALVGRARLRRGDRQDAQPRHGVLQAGRDR